MSTKRVLLLRPFPESPPPEAGAQWTLEAVGSIPWLSVDGMENLPQRSQGTGQNDVHPEHGMNIIELNRSRTRW
jgi:hypothetical protein